MQPRKHLRADTAVKSILARLSEIPAAQETWAVYYKRAGLTYSVPIVGTEQEVAFHARNLGCTVDGQLVSIVHVT